MKNRFEAYSKYLGKMLVSLGLVVVLMGCTANPLTTPTPDLVLADCFVYFYLSAWVDVDGDGVWDEEEVPLPGIEFSISGKYATSLVEGRQTSDENGEASIDTWSPGACLDDAGLTVHAEPPEGYEVSTGSPVLHDASSGLNGTYTFGFRMVAE